jgi:hypothetical protein
VTYFDGADIQKAAEHHLELCELWRFHYEEGGPEPDEPDPSAGPYCGCETCMVREVLYVGWQMFKQDTDPTRDASDAPEQRDDGDTGSLSAPDF